LAEPALAPADGRGHALLADAVEALSEGLALFDDDGRLVLFNARFREMNPGLAPLIAPGTPFDLLLNEAVARGTVAPAPARRLAWIENRLEPGDPPETIEVETAAGTVIATTLAPTRGGGFVLTLRDVTARRRLAAEAREADLMLRQVLEACPAAVLMSRLDDGQILYRSPAATELVGAVRDMTAIFASREERADFVTALMPEGRVDDLPLTCLRPGAASFPASISARLIDQRGEDVVVSSLLDLTQEHAMRAELARQREAIFQAEKMSALGELLAGVAHELNNPLSVVVGHALMLREEATDPDTLRRIDKIGQAAERCARIVKSFLAMARQEPAVLAPVDLAVAVSAAIDGLRHGPSPIRARLEVRFPADLPCVMADEGQLAQVIVNLVCNADQALEGRMEPSIEVAATRAGGHVRLSVADNGPGIPGDLRTRIFDPFFTTKGVGEGTGLGLALCHRIVTAHGGTITVEDRPGGGALFTVMLPAAEPVSEPGVPDAGNGAAPAPARVLLVEDEADVAELLADILRRAGFETVHAPSAEAALHELGTGDFAAILSDLAMPGLGGRGLHTALEASRPELLRRLAFVTGDTMGPSARAFLDATGRPRLEKPIAPGELRTLVRRLLESGP
jgi:signal transduction histidine kinase/CheY-like chemotaxis protein/PAS domain-containing protein